MTIERHDAGNGEHFHTIQGLLDCGHCNAVLANMPPLQGLDDESEDILVCQSCGSEFYPEELADARVEEILERVNERVENPNCTMIGESRVMELEEKEAKYDKLQEQVKLLREALQKAHEGLDSAARYFDKMDRQTVVEAVEEALQTVSTAIEATKET